MKRRYDRLVHLYPAMDWLFFLPRGIRKRAVQTLQLAEGGRVVEIGAGSGKNLPYLVKAIGPDGRIVASDVSPGMLRVARRRCRRHAWNNVTLIESDAAALSLAAGEFDGVLFALSYSAISDHDAALRTAWDALRPGGRLVILDAKINNDLKSRAARPFVLALTKATVGGNPDKRAWEDLRAYSKEVEMTEYLSGAYFICSTTKQ
jgi:ubiquinone/menaquinone biosynthesis C-methylase UbiE